MLIDNRGLGRVTFLTASEMLEWRCHDTVTLDEAYRRSARHYVRIEISGVFRAAELVSRGNYDVRFKRRNTVGEDRRPGSKHRLST